MALGRVARRESGAAGLNRALKPRGNQTQPRRCGTSRVRRSSTLFCSVATCAMPWHTGAEHLPNSPTSLACGSGQGRHFISMWKHCSSLHLVKLLGLSSFWLHLAALGTGSWLAASLFVKLLACPLHLAALAAGWQLTFSSSSLACPWLHLAALAAHFFVKLLLACPLLHLAAHFFVKLLWACP